MIGALERADAGILCVQPMEGELAARMAIVAVVERRRMRYAHMIGVTPRIMREGMRADYRQVDRLSQQLCDRMQSARMLSVRTAAGTDFTATFDREPGLGEDQRHHQPALLVEPARRRGLHDAGVGGRHASCATARPATTSMQSTASSIGRRSCSRSAAAGSCRRDCDRLDLERDFWSYCHTDANSDRVGELAFGTNLGLREMIGILLQDEKIPGVHLAFGDPYGSQTHADWSSRTHVDVLTRDCDVWIDDEQVIAEGQYLLEKFADVGPAASRSPTFRAGADVVGSLRTPKVTA